MSQLLMPKMGAIRTMSRVSRTALRAYSNIIVDTKGPNKDVSLITLNRPKALNALNQELFDELNDALGKVDKDDSIGAIVLTGSKKAFAAGADIKQMKDKTYEEVIRTGFLRDWGSVYAVRKPIIAAVSGYALGGGCELAMMCDIILAAPTAKFGQPEIQLGVIPGGGGTQRLTHAIGKSRAMELILTGRNFSAQEAASWGLVSRVVGEGEDEVVHESLKLAEEIASKGRYAVLAAKQATKAAYELSLASGLDCELNLFHGLFATSDQKEGMSAFAEKRKPTWSK